MWAPSSAPTKVEEELGVVQNVAVELALFIWEIDTDIVEWRWSNSIQNMVEGSIRHDKLL